VLGIAGGADETIPPSLILIGMVIDGVVREFALLRELRRQ
jgi:hypothetical protein